MKTRRLGPFTVSAIGLGSMPLSLSYSPIPSEKQAIATIHAALDAGITYLDTADIYAPTWDTMGHNERLMAKALKSYSGNTDKIIIGTKAGIKRAPGASAHGNETWARDGSPAYLRGALDKALKALEVETIDLFYWHRPDRWRVYGEVVETFRQFKQEGKIRAVGISNANVEEIEVALEVLGDDGLAAVQNEFSPSFRSSEDELALCGNEQVTFVGYAPFGGQGKASSIGDRFGAFAEIGADHGVSPQQVVLAWQLSLGDQVIPIPGATRPESIIDSARAVDLELSAEELERCSATGGPR